MLKWRSLCDAERGRIALQYSGAQETIIRLCAKAEIHENPHAGDDLGSLGPFLQQYPETIRSGRLQQDALYRRERELDQQNEKIKVLVNATMTAIYETAPKYYLDSVDHANTPDFLTIELIKNIGLGKSCTNQMRAARLQLQNARESGADLDARGMILRYIQGFRTNMAFRESRLLALQSEPELQEKVRLVHFPTALNLQQLQDRLPPLDTAEQDAPDLARQNDRLLDGRPRQPEGRNIAGWPNIINGIVAPQAALENEMRMAQLAANIVACRNILEDQEADLHGYRGQYFSSLSSNLCTFESMTRAWYEEERLNGGSQPFAAEEAHLSKAVEISRKNLVEAERAMRSYIDSKRVPTEVTFREQTNDGNSGNDAVGLRMLDAQVLEPGRIRRWQAGIARVAIPTGSSIALLPSWREGSIDMSSVGYSEQLSNGNGSVNSAEVVSRRRKWLQKNEAIVRQKREHLESQGVVFQNDAMVQH